MNAQPEYIDAEVEDVPAPALKPASQALTQPKQQAVQVSEPISESAAIFQIIERAARDQTVDIDKMKQLMAMHQAMQANQAELAFDDAMAAAQAEMEPVRADANNPQTHSKYASYAALDAAIRPIYTKHGFSVSFNSADGAPEGYVRVVAKVAHRGGHRERPHLDMPADGKGAKGGDVMTKTHAVGSAVQYGRRYLLGMIFNLAVSKDDDGNAAGRTRAPDKINAAQLKRLQALLDETESDVERFCHLGGIDALPDMLAADFDDAIRMLEQKKRKLAEAAS
jgi:hypothetical protein